MSGLYEKIMADPKTRAEWEQSAAMKGIVETVKDRCKRCYACVRYCPAKAIKVEEGQAKVITERCIGCGNCVKVCAQSAKIVQSGVRPLVTMIDSGEHVVAALAPSFPIAFHEFRPGQLVTAVKRLGVAEVVEVAFGAQLVARECARLVAESDGLLISTACPAVIMYVEKYLPALVPYLAPVVSPMIAMGRYVKAVMNPRAKVVFIGPCIAKKAEAMDPLVSDAVDGVLTFYGLKSIFKATGIDVGSLPETEFDGPAPGSARIFPMPGGLLATARMHADLVKNEVVVTHGAHPTLTLLHELAVGTASAQFADVLICDGCIDGPRIENKAGLFARRRILAEYVRSPLGHRTEGSYPAAGNLVDLSRAYEPRPVILPTPTEEQIREALRLIGKLRPEDELNCGACGYESCREKAIAVCQGLAESEMCLPYLIDKLQENYTRLERLHAELKELDRAKSRFVRLVSHELRAPVAAIMQYVDVLASGAVHSTEERGQRALHRCQERGTALLNLIDDVLNISAIEAGGVAQSRAPLDLTPVLRETVELFHQQAEASDVALDLHIGGRLRDVYADRDDLARLFANLISNAIKYNRPGGSVRIAVQPAGQYVRVDVVDSGFGIPEELQPRLFEEFFRASTPETRHVTGTGLGLSIVKAIVKAHDGHITVQSKYGEGTTFTVHLPAHSPRGGRSDSTPASTSAPAAPAVDASAASESGESGEAS